MSNKIINTQVIWGEKAWQFRVDDVVLPNGKETQQSYIDHPGSVLVVPMLDENTVVMIRQYRHGLDEVIWELPAGSRDYENEPWLDCAQRELMEEAGYRAERFTELGDIWLAPGMANEVLRIYLAEGLSADSLPADLDEQIEVVPMPLSDALDLVKKGEIKDAKTIIALSRV